jgi:chromosome segregation ATPase
VVQAAMYFALGLLTAGLFALLLTPAIWRRAARLTRARVEAAMPMTLAEIDADKDQLRANFAVANRRLELDASILKEKLATATVAVGIGRDEVNALTRSRAALADTVATLEERVAELGGALSTTENKLATANSEIGTRDDRLAKLEASHADLRTHFDASQLMTEEQRLELVARATEIVNLTNSLAGAMASDATTAEARDKLSNDLGLERDRLIAEQRRSDGLAAGLAALQAERLSRIADLERNAADIQTLGVTAASERTRATTLAAEVAALKELEHEIAEERAVRTRLAAEIDATKAERLRIADELAERARQIAELNARILAETTHREEFAARLQASEAALATAEAATAALHQHHQADIMAEGDNFRKATAAAQAEKENLALRVAALEDDYAALRAENTELRHVAGAEWESEREENRRLRERLAEIAMSVVRLTQYLETGGAPATSSDVAADAAHPATAVEDAQADEGGNTLADRLRAVQLAGTRH